MRYPSLSFDHDVNEAREDYGGFRFAKGGFDAVPAVATAAPAPNMSAAPQAPPPEPSFIDRLLTSF